MKEDSKKNKRQSWGPFFKLIKKTKLPYLWILACIAASLLVAQLNLMFPSYTEKITAGDFSTGIIIATIAVLFGGALADTLYQATCTIVKGMISQRFRDTTWNKVIRLPMRFYDKNGTTELISRVAEDTTKLSDFLTDDVAGLVSNVYTLAGTMIMLFSYDWHLVIAEAIIIPLIIIIGILKGRIDFRWNNTLQLRVAQLTGGISEILTNIPLVKTFVQEKKATAQSKEKTDELFRTKMTMTWIANGFSGISTILTVAESLIVILFGVYLIKHHIITVSVWVAFYLYSTNLSGSIDSIMEIWDDLKVAQGAMRRIAEVSREEEDSYDDGDEYASEHADIKFTDVSFGYDENQVLSNINITIPFGKTTAIVGMSGAGKSTILNLLERFYEPDSGSINYGDKAISEYSLRSWRNSVGYVTQDAWLVEGTVRENLTYQCEDEMADEEIFKNLEKIGMSSLIDELDNGLDTQVGDGGSNLSGGQRQRIGFARMLMDPPDIILLDEVTSNLDACAEHDVNEAIHSLPGEHTVVAITHKIRTVKDADQIIVMENGQIKEVGTHETLLNEEGVYHSMWVSQNGEGGSEHE